MSDPATWQNYMEGVPESLQNEKRALLALMAEKGTEGQAEYDALKARQTAARNASVETAAARGAAINAPETLQAELTQDYDKIADVFRRDGEAGALAHAREMDRIAAANAAYKDQVAAAGYNLRDTLNAQLEAARMALEADAAARRGGGGGGGGGGSDGFGGFGGLGAEELPTAAPEDPERLLRELIRYADTELRGPGSLPPAMRDELFSIVDAAESQGALTAEQAAMVRERLNLFLTNRATPRDGRGGGAQGLPSAAAMVRIRMAAEQIGRFGRVRGINLTPAELVVAQRLAAQRRQAALPPTGTPARPKGVGSGVPRSRIPIVNPGRTSTIPVANPGRTSNLPYVRPSN